MSQMGLWGRPEPGTTGRPGERRSGVAGASASAGVGRSDFVNGGLLVIPADAPLALRMTPRTFDEFVGQEDVIGQGKALRTAIEGDRIPSMLFWGPPGIGKTALARLVAMQTHSTFRELSAVTSGVQDVRDVVAEATRLRREGKRTILFLDEIHRFNKAQQDALLPHAEKGTIILIGATTENPYFSVNPALLSRMSIFTFGHLSQQHIETIVRRAIEDRERGLLAGHPGSIEIEDKAFEHIVGFSKGDARVALNVLEALFNVGSAGVMGTAPATSSAQAGSVAPATAAAPLGSVSPDTEAQPAPPVFLSLARALEITQSPQLFYDKLGDQHYDIISAFIKSMRGSDPDAVVYWLARMLEAGEDPRFVARRIVICAAEDVGLADPMAVVVAEAAFRASEHIGMPEARIPLAEAALYVALAPKSNSAYLAIDKAIAEVREKPAYPVPVHLRGTGYSGAEKLGHGVGYKYPHDYPEHWVEQEYLPPELVAEHYFHSDERDRRSR